MMRKNMVIFLLAFLVDDVFGDTEEVKSVMEGNSVTLYTDIIKKHNDTMLWYFNNTRIALINGGPSKSCLYDGEGGRFRDRLKMEYETGSLIITDLTSEHAGRYEANIIIETQGTTSKINRTSKCNSTKIIYKNSNPKYILKSFSLNVSASDSGKNKNEGSGLSTGVVAGIVGGIVGVVLLVAAVVFGCWKFNRSIFRKFEEKQSSEKQVPNDETQNEKGRMI